LISIDASGGPPVTIDAQSQFNVFVVINGVNLRWAVLNIIHQLQKKPPKNYQRRRRRNNGTHSSPLHADWPTLLWRMVSLKEVMVVVLWEQANWMVEVAVAEVVPDLAECMKTTPNKNTMWRHN